MKILIGADVFATDDTAEAFRNADIERLMGVDLNETWNRADVRIFNLEGPITKRDITIVKNGPHLKMDEDVLPGLRDLKPTVVTLANNHIMDYGEDGALDTINLLKQNGIDYVGIGADSKSAAETFYIKYEGLKIGVYACAETEFSIVENGVTANGYNPLEICQKIQESKQKCDYLIVLYHGGRECYRLPSPLLQKRFRKMAESGADVVVAQHTHCVGCYELYNDSLLVYGQGNFIFNARDNEYWNSGLLVELDVDIGRKDYHFIPIVKTTTGVKKADGADYDEIIGGFYQRSRAIETNEEIQKSFDNIADDTLEVMLRSMAYESILFRIVNKIVGGGLVYRKYKKVKLIRLLNYIECESHRELLIRGLKRKLKEEA